MWHVLAVEDSADCQRLIARALEARCRVSRAGTLAEARRKLAAELPDLVLIDVGLPDGDGYQLCSLMQSEDRTRRVPVLFLTGRGETPDKLLAFAAGADDYLVKPFDPRELRARVETRLAKLEARARDAESLRLGPLHLDLPRFRACLDGGDGEPCELDLTPHEFRLLHCLAARPGHVFSRGRLLEAVWGETVVSERTVDSHVSNLRRKLGALGGRLEAVRGVGYRLRAA